MHYVKMNRCTPCLKRSVACIYSRENSVINDLKYLYIRPCSVLKFTVYYFSPVKSQRLLFCDNIRFVCPCITFSSMESFCLLLCEYAILQGGLLRGNYMCSRR